MALDERLRRELEQAGRPADPSGVYEELIRRHERRRLVRRAQVVALTLIVVIGTSAGLYGLSRVFGDNQSQAGSPPAANGRITYVFYDSADSGDRTSILAVEPDGTDPRELVKDAPLVTDLDWTSDGRRLLYGWGEIFVLDLGTGRNTRIAGPNAFGPSWSPDGSQVTFAIDGSPRDRIVVANSDGTDPKVVMETGDVGWTDWSPDGTKILFVGPGPEGAYQGWDIYTMKPDGTGVTNLTNSPDIDLDPSWSPDGSTILFRSRPSEPPDGSGSPDELFLMAPDGRDLRRLTHDDATDQSPAWSPDGTRIVFTSAANDSTPSVVYTMQADGTDRVRLPVTQVIAVAWQPRLEEGPTQPTPSEVPTPTPESSPSASGGQDLGLGFPVCNVSSIDGRFVSPDDDSSVFVATRVGDTGGCPLPQEAFNVVALDEDGDGLAESSFGPIECEFECRTFSAPDIDGDGTDELLVVQGGGAVVRAHLYDIAAAETDPGIVPLLVAAPGDPKGGFDPGQQATFLVGGDAFSLYGLQCGDVPDPDGPGLVATSAESLPNDSPDAEWHAHQTTLVWQEDGVMHVVDVRDFTEPVTDDPAGPSFRSGETLCGSNLGP